jgi:hypothetical protein
VYLKRVIIMACVFCFNNVVSKKRESCNVMLRGSQIGTVFSLLRCMSARVGCGLIIGAVPLPGHDVTTLLAPSEVKCGHPTRVIYKHILITVAIRAFCLRKPVVYYRVTIIRQAPGPTVITKYHM